MAEREFVMPVAQSDAMGQFFIQAMRDNTDVLKELRKDMKEDRRTLLDVRDRVTRIESNRVDSRVATLEGKVEALVKAEDGRTSVANVRDWWLKHLPTIGAIVVAFLTAIVLTLKISGKI